MRYFFDLGGKADEIGTELASEWSIPREAFRLLLDVAREMPTDPQQLTVVVRGADQVPLYEAVLRLDGMWTNPAEVRRVKG